MLWVEEKSPTRRLNDFLFDLYQRGVPIGDKIKVLRKRGYLNDYVPDTKKEYILPIVYGHNKEGVTVIKDGAVKRNISKKPVLTEDWKPESVSNHSEEFVKWIDSINGGFKNKIYYHPFNLYCQQSEQWLAANENFADYKDRRSQMEFAVRETKKIQDNSLYFLDKYVYFKSGSSGNKYRSAEAQRVAAFLADCGYCLMLGKGRQIWFSTTIGAIAIKRINFNKNYFVKFIAENLVKTEEIFTDKIKFPFYHLPEWMHSSVNNDQDGLFRLMFKERGKDKGNVSGADSKVQVEAPYPTAINGGSPDLVLLDEIGQIDIIDDIIEEGRPTLFGYNSDSNTLKQIRQIICWGTGAQMDRGGTEFEMVFTAALKAWEERDFSYGIIPVFFDYWARPGMTAELYESEKRRAYSKNNEPAIIRFHQHYPANIQDMFLTTAETIVPINTINDNLQASRKNKGQRGYFVPIYDTSKKMTGYVPFAITGTTFVPVDDTTKAPVVLYANPDMEWSNRYYQGTDPINSQSGHSYLSSAIWDAHACSVSCLLNSRTMDYRYEYLQTILMAIHYGMPPHLIEINVGRELVNFIDLMKGSRSIILQSQLPPSLQVSTSEIYGINKRGSNTPFIHNRLIEMLDGYSGNIQVEDFWVQLKTFIKKDNAKKSEVTFGVGNYRKQRDDAIYSVLYSYIGAQCYAHKAPSKGEEAKTKRVARRYMCNESTGWNTVLADGYVQT